MSLPLAEPVEHVAEFLVYAMPGFVALHVYRTVYPVKRLSEFLQAAWSLIYGVVLAGLVRGLDEDYFYHRLHSTDEGFPRLVFIFGLVVAGFAWGFVLVGINKSRSLLSGRFQALRFIAPDVQSIWAKVNQNRATDWAVVYTADGAVYMGWIKEFTYDPDADDNDFLLSKAKCMDENLGVKYEVDGQGVYLNTRDVKRIEFVKGVSFGRKGDDGLKWDEGF
jgi:hypothetical protein